MPYMDDQQFIDDLFGDSEPVAHVHVPQHPAVKDLSQRLEELYTSGCCQKIAWSKAGVVASISPDSLSLNVQIFRRSHRSKAWGLGPKSTIQLPDLPGEPLQFTHVTWSHFGVDLIAIDRFGRILIWGTYTGALGRMMPMPVHVRDAEHASYGIIGLHWLPVLPSMKNAYFIWSATRPSEQAPIEYNYSQHVTTGPSNSNEGRPAFFCLTQNGILRFFWQLDGPWRDIAVELGSFTQAGQAFTHASFCAETERSLILAAHNNLGSLYIYRVEIGWKQIPDDKDKPPKFMAAFRINQLFVEENFGPGIAGDVSSPDALDIPHQLTHLDILPPTTARGIPQSLPMTIMASFVLATPALPLEMDPLQQSPANSTRYTVLTSWEIQRKSTGLNSCFDKFNTKSKSTSSIQARETRTLLRQVTVTMPSVVLSLECLRYNTMIAFVMGDGSIEFRDRDNLDMPIHYAADPNPSVGTLASAGFGFGNFQSHAHIVLSPNHCMAACMDMNGKITLSRMVNLMASAETSNLSTTAIMGLVIHFSNASSVGWQVSDDILAMLQSAISNDSLHEFLEYSCDALRINLDCTTLTPNQHAPAQLWHLPNQQRLWGAQAILGTHKTRRDISGRLGWTALQMRSTLLNFFRTFKDNKELSPEIARSLLSPITWVQDLVTLVMDELFETWRQTKDIVDNLDELKKRFTEKPPMWVILVLCSGPRHLLRLLYRQLLITDGHVRAALKTAGPTAKEKAFACSSVVKTLQDCPIRPKTIEALALEVEQAVRADAYDAAGVTAQQRSQHERRMLIRGEIPEILFPVVQKLFRDIMPKRLQEVDDMSAVRQRDIRQLGLTTDKRTQLWQEEHVVDVMRRTELPKGTKLRRCTRCSCAIEDDYTQELEPRWLSDARRQCICSGPWYLESGAGVIDVNGARKGSVVGK